MFFFIWITRSEKSLDLFLLLEYLSIPTRFSSFMRDNFSSKRVDFGPRLSPFSGPRKGSSKVLEYKNDNGRG